MSKRKLFLTGYTGCGKTSLGRKLAQRLGVRFVDTDAEIEHDEQASVSDIFRYEGEAHFRQAERAMLERLAAEDCDMIVSTGGGLPVWGDNAERLNSIGTTVYIARPAEQIARRLTPYGRAKRPRLHGLSETEIVEFMERDIAVREPFYAKARFRVDGGAYSDGELLEQLTEIFLKGDEQ